MADKIELPEPYAFLAKTIMLPYHLSPEGEEALLIACNEIYKSGVLEGRGQGLKAGNDTARAIIDSKIERLAGAKR